MVEKKRVYMGYESEEGGCHGTLEFASSNLKVQKSEPKVRPGGAQYIHI